MKVPPGWDIPVEIRIQLGDRSGRQRELVADEHVVLIVHKVPTAKSNHRDAVYFWRTPAGEWRSTERGQPKPALQRIIDAYEDAVESLGDKHDTAVHAGEKFSVLEQLAPINRAIRNLSDTLGKAQQATESPEAQRELQDYFDHANDVARSCELLHIDARNALDFHIARQSEIQAGHSREVERATHRLNTMATIFLPLTAMASVFGMNLKSGLENSPPWMFWAILGGSILAGLFVSEALAAFKLRKRSRV